MANTKLTGHQKAHLRGLGQTLAPALSVGKGGITQTVVRELERLLASHELIKVRLLAERVDRDPLMEGLAAGTGAEVVGSIGKTVLLFRRAPASAPRRINLPAAPSA